MRFLGTLEISHQGRILPTPPTQKSQSQLAYLAMYRHQPHSRKKLSGLFWGSSPERKARHSLATSLWHIRACLPDNHYIQCKSQMVRFNTNCDLQLDVDEFESLAAFRDDDRLFAAVELYQGPFLDGFYDDWVIDERHRLEALYLDALARMMDSQEKRGQYAAALVTAKLLLSCDVLREDAHRLAMRAYCKLGQRNAALEQYRRCYQLLQKQLGVRPMVETSDLYQAILKKY